MNHLTVNFELSRVTWPTKGIPGSGLRGLVVATILSIVFCSQAPVSAGELPEPEIKQVKFINEVIERHWNEYDPDRPIVPSPVEDDGKWCRRVFLDLIGRIPTYRELQDFIRDRNSRKREALVERLLYDGRYTEEYANHWASIWSNILIGRSGGFERGSMIDRDGMAKYLRDSFASNKPYDRMVYELVTATGATKPGTEKFNGATNFLIDKVNEEKGTLATAATSKVFLGLQVQCTQCHNHPFNEWKQRKFWEFNAYFRQTRALRRLRPGATNRNDIDFGELVNEDFKGESGSYAEADIFYEERNGVSRVAYPVFIDGESISRSGYVLEEVRRDELGRQIVNSEYLGKMIVNRTWTHFLGYAFTKPMDDLGQHTMVSHPELLETLAAELKSNSYDLKALMKWIALSKPYQLSSEISKGNEVDDPTVGEVPQFSHFYLRQMTPEQLYQSMISLGGSVRGSLTEQRRQRDSWLRQFVVSFGTDEGDEATTFNGSIPQALMMFNGDLVERATATSSGSWLSELNGTGARMRDKVNAMFLAGLARKARPNEIKVASSLVRAREGKVDEALQDLWWAVLNSNEFILIH